MTQPERQPRRSLLVVDDDSTIRTLLHAALRGRYDVACVPNGEGVPGMVAARKPDLVLLDINVPGSEGHALCAGIRKEASLQGVPILFMTVVHGAAGFFESLNAGGNSCIRKPFEIPKLLGRIETALRGASPN